MHVDLIFKSASPLRQNPDGIPLSYEVIFTARSEIGDHDLRIEAPAGKGLDHAVQYAKDMIALFGERLLEAAGAKQ